MSDWFSGRRSRGGPGGFGPAFETLQSELNRVFSDFGMQPGQGFPGAAAGSAQPHIDVLRTREGGFEIHAELPGLTETDIDLTVDESMLTLSGERRVDRDRSRGEWRVKERATGAFSRTIALPFEARPEQIDAEFRNGVLTIKISPPRGPERSGVKVNIRSGGVSGGAGGVDTIESQAASSEERVGVPASGETDGER